MVLAYLLEILVLRIFFLYFYGYVFDQGNLLFIKHVGRDFLRSLYSYVCLIVSD